MQTPEIPGLFSTDQGNASVDWSSDGQANSAVPKSNVQNQNSLIMLGGKSLLTDLTMEKDNLDQGYVHSHRLLDNEIAKVKRGSSDVGNTNHSDPNARQSDKIYVSLREQKQHNLLGRLLGPKGMTLKRIQAETQTKMSILGRGSMKDKSKEEELRSSNDPSYEHLNEDLHILVDAHPPYSHVKLAAGVAEVRKMMIPLEMGMEDLVVAKFLDPVMQQQLGYPGTRGSRETPLLPSPMGDRRGGGRGGSGRGMRGPGGGGGRGMRGGSGGRGMRGGSGGRGGGGFGRGGGGGGGRGGPGRGGPGAPRRGGRGGPRDGSGGGPIRSHSSGSYDSFDHRPDYPDRRGGGGRGGGGYGEYDGGRGGYGDRGNGRSDSLSNSVGDGDPYYSSFSDPPAARGYASHDYNHGSDSGWKSGGGGGGNRRDQRHHPYQQSGGYGNY